MTILSTGPLSVSPYAYQGVYTPFTLYGELKQTSSLTFSGNRWERIRQLEKTANIIELTLRSESVDIAYPVKFTNQFGNEPARVTINGNWGDGNRSEVTAGTKPPAKIAADVDRINANVVETGQGSFNAADLDPDPAVDELVSDIKAFFESKVGTLIEVMALDVHGVMYGRRGRHFPGS